jgi:hypothetical protein
MTKKAHEKGIVIDSSNQEHYGRFMVETTIIDEEFLKSSIVSDTFRILYGNNCCFFIS